MIKVVAAVIKYEDKVLLMRRASGQKYAGFWEFPGGKVEDGERTSAALKRELDEELDIKAQVGKLITSASHDEYEVFAYDVKYYDGLIRLSVHDDMEWVQLNEALTYKLLPADKKIVMHMTKTKEIKQENNSLDSVLCKIIEKPDYNPQTKMYVVKIKNPLVGSTRHFPNQAMAMNFYIETVRHIIKSSQVNRYTR